MTSDFETEDAPPRDDAPVIELRARTVSGDVHIARAAVTPA